MTYRGWSFGVRDGANQNGSVGHMSIAEHCQECREEGTLVDYAGCPGCSKASWGPGNTETVHSTQPLQEWDLQASEPSKGCGALWSSLCCLTK